MVTRPHTRTGQTRIDGLLPSFSPPRRRRRDRHPMIHNLETTAPNPVGPQYVGTSQCTLFHSMPVLIDTCTHVGGEGLRERET